MAKEIRLPKWKLGVMLTFAVLAAVALFLSQFHYYPGLWLWKQGVLYHGFELPVRTLPLPRNVDFSQPLVLPVLTTRIPKQWTYRVTHSRSFSSRKYPRYYSRYMLFLSIPRAGRTVRMKMLFNGFEPVRRATGERRHPLGLPTVYKRYFSSFHAFRENFNSDLALWMAVVANRNSEDASWGFGTRWKLNTTCLIEKVLVLHSRQAYIYRNLRGVTMIFAAVARSMRPAGGYNLGWFSRSGHWMAGWNPEIFKATGGTPRSVVMKLIAIFFAHARLRTPPKGWILD
jgi:hypothetical protein